MADPVSYLFSSLPGDAYGADTSHPVGLTDFMNLGAANDLSGWIRLIETFLRQIKSSEQWDRWLGITPPNSPSASPPTYVSGTQFTLPGDWTTATSAYPIIMAVNRRLRATVTAGTIYGYISAVSFAAGTTTVTAVWDSGALDAGLSEVQVAALGAGQTGNTAIPQNILNLLSNNPVYTGTTTGSGTYTTTLSPAPASLAALQGTPIFVTIGTANAGTTTLAPNGFAATPVRKYANGSIVELGKNDLEPGAAILVHDGTQFLVVGILNQVPQFAVSTGARGLKGTSPGSATTLTLSATQMFLNAATSSYGAVTPGFNVGATLDISTAGPALNGRDQAGSFSNGSTVHVYGIYGAGQTTGLIASLTAPGTGPTLPANYTNFGYLMSFIMSGANIPALYVDGNTVYYTTQQSVLSGGQSSSEANISLASVVPSNALKAILAIGPNLATPNAGGFNGGTVRFRLATGADFFVTSPGAYAAGHQVVESDVMLEVPNNISSQNLIYIWTAVPSTAGGAGFALNVWVLGYSVPNNA